MNTFQIIHLYLNKLTCTSYLNQSKSNSYLEASPLPLIFFLRIVAVSLGLGGPEGVSGSREIDLLPFHLPHPPAMGKFR